ncbi:MAG TPA: fibronectin type III domain-containing protein [Candidatus Sulfotelmatobacter sp.]|nr:fibronectin type III domain-containing protein [Candidatus Sulfotelmatobacter sp.]
MNRAAAPVALVFCLIACALMAGCAAPGEPTARHPVVPTRVTDLAAQQSGNSFTLHFALPARSTDREPLAEHPAVEIYRAKLPPGAVPDKKAPWRLAYTIPSEQVDHYLKDDHVEFHDPLAPEDFAGAGSSLAYKVRTRAVRAQASADSNMVVARAYSPPDAPQDVKTAVMEDAVEISWTVPAVASNAQPAYVYRVYREEVESPAQDQTEAGKLQVKAPFALLGETSATQFQDRNFEFRRTYVYSVRSVAQYGNDTVESDQPASSMATLTPRDVFPPAAPTGLEVAVIPATPGTPAYVELSWAISPEPDLAGYSVYRSEDENSPGERIGTETLLSPAFRDMSVQPNRRYFYRVSALDRAGNESPKSSATVVDVP